MPRHTIRTANSHKRHRIATLVGESAEDSTRVSNEREMIPDHPIGSLKILDTKLFPTREPEHGFFDLNSTLGPGALRKDNANWRKGFNYSALTMYPLEITDYDSKNTLKTLAVKTAQGIGDYKEALGSSRQYKGKTFDANGNPDQAPTSSQWHSIGGVAGGNHHVNGISVDTGLTGATDPESHLRTAARFMLNPTTSVMKNVDDPFAAHDITESQYIFQVGRYTGQNAKDTNGNTLNNNGWTIDDKYEVSFSTNPISLGDGFGTQPAYAKNSTEDTWNGFTVDGVEKTLNQANWRNHVAGLGDEYAKVLLEGTNLNGMNFGTDLVRNPKWNPLTSRVQGIGGGQGTVDTGVISSYTSNILCAGTGVCVAQGADTKTASAAAGGSAGNVGEFTDGVQKLGCSGTTGVSWAGNDGTNLADTGNFGGIFLPWYHKSIGTMSNGKECMIGVKYIGHKNLNGMANGFIAQYTGYQAGGAQNPVDNVLFEQTKKDYYTETIHSWENAFGCLDGGTIGEKHITEIHPKVEVTSTASTDVKINRRAPMENTGKDSAMLGENNGRDFLSHAWVEYKPHGELSQVIIVPEITDAAGDAMSHGDVIDLGTPTDQSPDIALGPSDAQRNREFAKKHSLVGEDFTLFTHSAGDLYHPSALVVAQFVRDTAEVFEDMHITELYPNANNMSAKSTWMRNYDIVFKISIDQTEDSTGPLFLKDDGINGTYGQTFTFSLSSCPYKIREISDRKTTAAGKHEWEIQAMPAWHILDETNTQRQILFKTVSGDSTKVSLASQDKVFQNTFCEAGSGSLTVVNGYSIDIVIANSVADNKGAAWQIGNIIDIDNFELGTVQEEKDLWDLNTVLNRHLVSGTNDYSFKYAADTNQSEISVNIPRLATDAKLAIQAGWLTVTAGASPVIVSDKIIDLVGNNSTPALVFEPSLLVLKAGGHNGTNKKTEDLRILVIGKCGDENAAAYWGPNEMTKFNGVYSAGTAVHPGEDVFFTEIKEIYMWVISGSDVAWNTLESSLKLVRVKVDDNAKLTDNSTPQTSKYSTIQNSYEISNIVNSGGKTRLSAFRTKVDGSAADTNKWLNDSDNTTTSLSNTSIKDIDSFAQGELDTFKAIPTNTNAVIGPFIHAILMTDLTSDVTKPFTQGSLPVAKMVKKFKKIAVSYRKYATSQEAIAAGGTSFTIISDARDGNFNDEETIFKASLIGSSDGPLRDTNSGAVVGDNISGSTIDTVQTQSDRISRGTGWLPDGAGDTSQLSFLQRFTTDASTVTPVAKNFDYVGQSAKFVYPITQYMTQPFLATSTAIRGLLFADKDYVTIEDVSFNLYSCGSWSLPADISHSYFDLREHVFDHMEGDLGIPAYYWDAYSSLQLERQLITLNNFSRFDMHRKISLCWWDVLRIFDADDDVPVYNDGVLELSQDNASRSISGNLQENDVLAISCVVRNPHPEVKDIDMRLIFQIVNTYADGSSSLNLN